MTYNSTAEQIEQLWDGYMQGQTVSQLARRLDERQEISRGLAAGRSLGQVATQPADGT